MTATAAQTVLRPYAAIVADNLASFRPRVPTTTRTIVHPAYDETHHTDAAIVLTGRANQRRADVTPMYNNAPVHRVVFQWTTPDGHIHTSYTDRLSRADCLALARTFVRRA